MTLTQIQKAAEIAKSRTSDKRWIAAIDKAVAGFESWIVTELAHSILVTTTSGETYHANGSCTCKAYTHGGKAACKHRALYRLIQIANEETAPAVSLAPVKNYCGDRDLQHLAHCKPHVSLADAEAAGGCLRIPISLARDVAATPRNQLIVEIKACWPKTWPPIGVELMARFHRNQLEMLDDDSLRRVRLAIAM